MADLKFHEAANIFPLLEGDDLQALAADIKAHGLQVPIELFEGKVIDGRNRKTACLLAGVEPKTITITTDDPVAYVLSANLHRRHLNETQRGLVAQRAREFYDKAAKERLHAGQASGGRGHKKDKNSMSTGSQSFKGPSRAQAGAAVGVSGITVDRVRDAMKTGVPELIQAMERGAIKANTAKRIARLPPDEQRDILSSKQPAPASTTPRKSKGSDGRPHVQRQATSAMQFATMAISQLERIRDDDPEREKALAKVEKWIIANRRE
jgi:hypothetical protein